MTAVHKKQIKQKHQGDKPEAAAAENIVASTETKPATQPAPKTEDPLSGFKEKMAEEESFSPREPAKKNYMWPILFVFIIAVSSLVGMFVYKNVINNKKNVNVVSLSPSPTITPEPTMAVDLTQYEIEILNGSEVAGEAGRQKEALESEGFVVSSIGNAATSDYEKTIIQAKSAVSGDFLGKLRNALEISFEMGDNEELPNDADSDVVIILGAGAN